MPPLSCYGEKHISPIIFYLHINSKHFNIFDIQPLTTRKPHTKVNSLSTLQLYVFITGLAITLLQACYGDRYDPSHTQVLYCTVDNDAQRRLCSEEIDGAKRVQLMVLITDWLI